jgi:hypothetical protein
MIEVVKAIGSERDGNLEAGQDPIHLWTSKACARGYCGKDSKPIPVVILRATDWQDIELLLKDAATIRGGGVEPDRFLRRFGQRARALIGGIE